MESDEPALVPQWLKGGGSTSSAFGTSHSNNSNGSHSNNSSSSTNSHSSLRDLNISTKRHIPDWEDRHSSDRNFRPQNFRQFDAAKTSAEDKHWKAQSEPFVGRPARHSRSNSFSDDRHNNAAGGDPRRGRGYGGHRGRDEVAGGADAGGDFVRDTGHRSSSQEDANLGYGARNAFDRNFPSLGEQRPPNGATPPSANPAFRQHSSGTGFLAAKASGNWTSKLADSPSTHTPAAAPTPTPNPTPTPAAPAPKMSEALQQTLTRATSADRQRLDQLHAKQSRTLIPVLAPASKPRTSSSLPAASKFLAPPRPDPAKLANGRAPAPSPFAAPKPAPPNGLQRAHSASAAAAPAAPAAGNSAAPALPNGMVALKPAGSGKVLERTSFFDSLRRKPSAEPSSAAAAAAAADAATAKQPGAAKAAAAAPSAAANGGSTDGPAAAAAASNGSAAAAAAAAASNGATAPAAKLGADQQQQLQQSPQGQENGSGGAAKGLAKLQSLAEAEEEAFLRSLGWEEPQEGEDEGLTEEEIAAFLAASEQRRAAAEQGKAQGQGRPAAGSAPRLVVVGGKGAGLRHGLGQAAFAPSSYNSQTTCGSDTDSDC